MTLRENLGLSQRLLILGILTTLALMAGGGYLLRDRLHNTILRSMAATLNERADRLASSLRAGNSGHIYHDPALAPEEYRTIFSGWYWQLDDGQNHKHSRSLWDSSLNPENASRINRDPALYRLTGPTGEPLLGIKREQTLGGRTITLHTYGPAQATNTELSRLDSILILMLMGMIITLLLSLWLQIHLGLTPLRRLHHALRGNTPAAAAPRAENPAPPSPEPARQPSLRYSGDYRLERPASPRHSVAESAAYYQWAQNIAPPPVPPSPSPTGGGVQDYAPTAKNDYAAAPVHDDNSEHPLGYALGQIHNIFILAQNAHGLIIVDMHAAHERILYERLKTQLRAKEPEVQRLLLPQSLVATPAHLDTLEQHRDWLHRLGFELAASADESRIHINAVPSLLKHAAVAEIVGDLLHELGEYPASIAIERMQDEILSRLSCHKAVRAHDSLTITEMNQLLRDIETTPASGQCNHGRPTWVQLTTDDLGKYFMRGE